MVGCLLVRAGVGGDNRIVVLDVGCAPGTSIEQVVRACNVTASHMNLSGSTWYWGRLESCLRYFS